MGDVPYYDLGSPADNDDLMNVIGYFFLIPYSSDFSYTETTYFAEIEDEEEDGTYIIQIYDPGSFDKNEEADYLYMTVSADFTSFSYTDAAENGLGDLCTGMMYISAGDLEEAAWGVTGEPAAEQDTTEAGIWRIFLQRRILPGMTISRRLKRSQSNRVLPA